MPSHATSGAMTQINIHSISNASREPGACSVIPRTASTTAGARSARVIFSSSAQSCNKMYPKPCSLGTLPQLGSSPPGRHRLHFAARQRKVTHMIDSVPKDGLVVIWAFLMADSCPRRSPPLPPGKGTHTVDNIAPAPSRRHKSFLLMKETSSEISAPICGCDGPTSTAAPVPPEKHDAPPVLCAHTSGAACGNAAYVVSRMASSSEALSSAVDALSVGRPETAASVEDLVLEAAESAAAAAAASAAAFYATNAT